MIERYKQCAFFQIVEQGRPQQRQTVIDNLCKPSCKEECPVRLPILEFTGDSVVPYIEKYEEPEFYVQGTA